MDAGGTAQAAAGTGGEDVNGTLDTLRLLWGPEYLFGYDPERGWWAIQSGRLGSLLTAASPEELGRQLAGQEEAGT